MNLDQRIRSATLGRSKQFCFQTCVWRNCHRHYDALKIGRLRQLSWDSTAVGTELICKVLNIHLRTVSKNFDVDRDGSGKLSHLTWCNNSSNQTTKHDINPSLKWLWQAICNFAVAAVRLLMAALVFCLASLLPRPAAAAAGCHTVPSAVIVADHSNRSEDAVPIRMLHCSSSLTGRLSTDSSSAATTTSITASSIPNHDAPSPRTATMPLADLAASSTAFASRQVAGPSRSPASSNGPPAALSAQRGDMQTAGSSRGTGVSSSPAAAATEINASGLNVVSETVASSSCSIANGGINSSISSNIQNAQVGDGGLAADPETVARAQHLGLSVAETGVVRMFERHCASVVNISGMRAMQTFTTLDLTKMPYGQGSGFLWGDKGHVVTCYHLVKGAAEVKVTLYDNTSYTAKVLGYDAAKNVAVLKLSVPKSKLRELQPVTLGSAAGLRVGQSVFGIGNPWGLGHTLSQGLISGLGLELSAGLFPIKGVILMDSAPDPGASGGVLLDSKGSVIGMLVNPLASSGGSGVGGGRSFAVPVDAIRGLINQILAYGRTVRPALGITMAPAQVLERVGLEGVLVLEVPPGSPAHAAGLRPTHRDIFGDLVLGDVVIGLDGKTVRSSADVYDILDEHRVGDRVKLDVVRDGKQTGLTITLGERLLGAVEE